ncbi:MAG: NAD-dependent epimerase/dehydratase family protein [Planctomycetota bacterium]
MAAAQYLVTGGLGFIGANLVATLQRERPGSTCVVIDSARTGTFANLVEACARISGEPFLGEVIPESVDAVDWASLIVETRPAAVFHLGAITTTTHEDESEMIRENAGESWHELLRIAGEGEVPLVYASSAATYGTPPQAARGEPFPESSAGTPDNVYGFSKWLMETAHQRYQQDREEAGLDPAWVIGLRYFNVFGPGEEAKGSMASMARQLTRQILDGQRPRLFRDGSQARDQVPVEDIIGLTLAAAGIGGHATPIPGVYNAGSGRATTFDEVADAVRQGLGVNHGDRPTEYFEMPASIARFYQSYTCADMRSAIESLGYTPAHDPIERIRSYAAWLAERTEAGRGVPA